MASSGGSGLSVLDESSQAQGNTLVTPTETVLNPIKFKV